MESLTASPTRAPEPSTALIPEGEATMTRVAVPGHPRSGAQPQRSPTLHPPSLCPLSTTYRPKLRHSPAVGSIINLGITHTCASVTGGERRVMRLPLSGVANEGLERRHCQEVALLRCELSHLPHTRQGAREWLHVLLCLHVDVTSMPAARLESKPGRRAHHRRAEKETTP